LEEKITFATATLQPESLYNSAPRPVIRIISSHGITMLLNSTKLDTCPQALQKQEMKKRKIKSFWVDISIVAI
jgi:hypothetical protein